MPPEKDDDKDKDKGASVPKEFTDTLKALADGQKAIVDGFAAMQESMQSGFTGLVDNLKPKEPDPKDKPRASFEDADLESMSRKEFMQAIGESLMGSIKTEMFEPLAEELKRVRVADSTDRSKRNLAELKDKNKDFDEWTPELREKIQANPRLSLGEALTLARSENPEKAEQLRAKYKVDDSDEGGEPRNNGKDRKFGGFRSDAGDEEGGRPSYKNSKEAADAAWEETMGSNEVLDLLSEGAQ